MTIWKLAAKEIACRKGSALLGVLAVAIAVGAPTVTVTMFRAYETSARVRSVAREQETRRRMDDLHTTVEAAMDALGFNVSLIPKNQDTANWLAADYGSEQLPADSLAKLAAARPQTLRKPVARLRRRIDWPETRWTVIVAGTEGLIPGQDKRRDEIQHIEPGSVWIGHEVWRGLELQPQTNIAIKGHVFRVARLLPQEGTRDDITIWMALADAQNLLETPGAINEIVAIGTRAAWSDANGIHHEIAGILPEARVVVHAGRTASSLRARLAAERDALAMNHLEEQSRREVARTRARMALSLNALMALVCGAWIGLLAHGNAVEREAESGLWFALGLTRARVARLFVVKWLAICLAGAVLALAIAVPMAHIGARWIPALAQAGGSRIKLAPDLVGIAFALALTLAAAASWLPVRMAAKRDPALLLGRGGIA